VPAYLHSVSEFVNASIEGGFNVVRLDELCDAKDEVVIPRLLLIHLRASKQGT
jgi:hypothetical protein